MLQDFYKNCVYLRVKKKKNIRYGFKHGSLLLFIFIFIGYKRTTYGRCMGINGKHFRETFWITDCSGTLKLNCNKKVSCVVGYKSFCLYRLKVMFQNNK